MKRFFTLGIFVFATLAYAEELNYSGYFSWEHEVILLGYENETSCTDDGGAWIEEGLCSFPGEDSVTVGTDLHVSIETVTTNAHMCSFEAQGVLAGPNLLIVSAPATEYEYDEETGEYIEVPVTCVVDITYQNGNQLSVMSNGKCSEFCGANAWLEIENAYRK